MQLKRTANIWSHMYRHICETCFAYSSITDELPFFSSWLPMRGTCSRKMSKEYRRYIKEQKFQRCITAIAVHLICRLHSSLFDYTKPPSERHTCKQPPLGLINSPELETIEFQSLRNAMQRQHLLLLHHVTQSLTFYSFELPVSLRKVCGRIFRNATAPTATSRCRPRPSPPWTPRTTGQTPTRPRPSPSRVSGATAANIVVDRRLSIVDLLKLQVFGSG